jgi:alpha-beta hydrolase superfamily lysophospholipase
MIMRWVKRIAILLAVVLLTVLGVRAWQSQQGAPLGPWQTFVPTELTASQLAHASWADYLANEDAMFAEIVTKVANTLTPEQCTLANRYCPQSPMYTLNFPRDGAVRDWNRSYILEPAGPPLGAVVLLHGLTDSPYSVRHLAQMYQARGWLALAIRLPGHGTVPAGLTRVSTDQWRAATRLAVHEAARRVPNAPIDIVGYSNGGALAIDYALQTLDDRTLPRAHRIILMSPEVAITNAARFAGIAGLPAIFPAFAKAAWLDILPEYNPFKYNSFPVNAARESFAMTGIVRRALAAHAAKGSNAGLPPMLTFQSVVDATVVMPAVVTELYANLPANGSELVVFDINRNAVFGPLMRRGAVPDLGRLLPRAPRKYSYTLVTNAGATTGVVARTMAAGATVATDTPLAAVWPPEVFSLGHVAIPFPNNDGLYGLAPDMKDFYGIRLGTLAVRGERGVLVVTPDALLRISSNPFFDYMETRIAAGLLTH